MGESIMSMQMFRKLNSGKWSLRTIRNHKLHGTGPVFAYSIYLKKTGFLPMIGSYWIYICRENESAVRMQITSNQNEGYSCYQEQLKGIWISGEQAFISVRNVLLINGSCSDLTVSMNLPDAFSREQFSRMIDLFAF